MRVCPIKLLSGLCWYYLKDLWKSVKARWKRIQELTFLAISHTACVPLHPSSKTLQHIIGLHSDGWNPRHVLVPSNPRSWGGCGPCRRPRVVCFWVCLAVAFRRLARSHSCRECDVSTVAAWRQRTGRGSKCDCSTVLLLDFAVKWDWRPSYLSDWLTGWLTTSYWEYLSFKCVIHAGTDLKGTECLGVRYVNKSGYYFLFGNVCWNCYVLLLFLQRTPCTWTVYTLCLVYLVST